MGRARDAVNRQPRGQRGPGRVWLLTAAMLLTSIALWSSGPLFWNEVPGPFHLSPLVVLAAFALAELMIVHFEFRGNAHALTLGELPLLIGLAFCTPAGLLAARLGGSSLALALWFRQSREKLAFNLTMHSLKVGVAVCTYRAALGSASPVELRGWFAAFCAAAVADIVSHVLIVAVITVTAGRPSKGALGPVAVTGSVAAVTNTGLALLALVILWFEPAAVVLLGFVAGVYAVGYRAHNEIRQRYANVQWLYRFTHGLSAAVTEQDVIDSVLRESRGVMRADRARLLIPIGASFRRYSMSDGDVVACQVGATPDALEREVLDNGTVVAGRRTSDVVRRAALTAAGYRDALAVPFSIDDAKGVLLVADRSSELSTFDTDDAGLLEALANHTAVAMHGGQLVERLREEVAAKEHQALHDQLTGLANRTLFSMRVDEALEARKDAPTVVMLMDLDRFKEINDTLGHHTGDTVLRHIAGRLVSAVGERGIVARLGGDEFAVVSTGIANECDAIALAQDVRAAAQTPVLVDGMTLEVQASVGIALAPEHGDDAATLLQRADVAMYDAKSEGGGITAYAPDNDHYTPRRLSLVTELRAALSDGNLALHYQPKVRMSDRRVVGVEALLRWNHPTYGPISPDEFIPVAEHSGLIAPLTSWVIDTALTQAARWNALGYELNVAVNVSARNVADERLLREITALLAKTGVPPHQLVLELTETSVMTDLTGGIDLLHRLSETGAHLSIDDFGTGYSSLSRLAKLPVDEVKIDRSFVMGMEGDGSNAVIVRSTIDLARSLGLSVVAEGVETTAAWDALEALRCDAVQGYLISRPLSPDAFLEWMADNGASVHMERALANAS